MGRRPAHLSCPTASEITCSGSAGCLAVLRSSSSGGTVGVVRADLVERFRGRWVALDAAGEVVADAAELAELLELVESAGVAASVVQRVPGLDDPVFVGLG